MARASGPSNYSGYNDVVKSIQRAKNAGMRVMLDFHYSDNWTDPGEQEIPHAWVHLASDTTALATELYNYTYKILTDLDALNLMPELVQVGNEINGNILSTSANNLYPVDFSRQAILLNAGISAVKAAGELSTIKPKTILHIASGNDSGLFQWNIGGLINNGFLLSKFDIIGMSLYPGENNWKTYVDDTYNNMIDLKSRYNKEVMMVEIGFSYSRQDITYQFITYMIEKTKQANGLGVFYWEPIARSPFTSYSKGAWDSDESPSIAMDAFLNKSTLSVENIKKSSSIDFNVYPNPSISKIIINALENQVKIIKLYNIKGSLLIEKKGKKSSLEIDISKLTTGIYFININNKVIKKIVKL